MSDNAHTMRAIGVSDWGGPEVLIPIETPRPVPGPTEILVRVHAAGINPTDWKSRKSGGFGLWNDPVILGFDVSGVVEQVGLGVEMFQPGDEVFGMPRFPRQAGAYAEYVAAPARHFARKPATLDHTQAAGLPLAGLTALQSLTDTAGLRPGQRVLIHAAAGGVGHLAVQIAKSLGAHVIGTASAGKHELLRQLGADELIDYTAVDFAQAVSEVDVVIDAVGGDYGTRSLPVLRPGGRLICLTGPDTVPPPANGIRTGFTLVEPDHAGLKHLAELADSGRLRVRIDTVFPLEQAAKAHELSESGRATGKIVLAVEQ